MNDTVIRGVGSLILNNKNLFVSILQHFFLALAQSLWDPSALLNEDETPFCQSEPRHNKLAICGYLTT